MHSEDPARKALASRLRTARETRGLMQQHVADRFGLSKGTVSAWELARGVPDALRLRDIAKLYGCSADFLLTGTVAPVAWPFSAELLECVIGLEPDDISQLENVMRAHLGMADGPRSALANTAPRENAIDADEGRRALERARLLGAGATRAGSKRVQK